MNYKSYPKSKDTPGRMARKGMRRGVFMFNKTAKRVERKANRLKRKSQALEQGE